MPKFEREVEIDAPIDKVWDVLTNPRLWPQWFPGVDGVTSAAAIQEGARIEWTSEDKTGSATIVDMEPMKRLSITTQVGNDKDSHVFKLRPSGGFLGTSEDETKVEYTLDTLMGGGIIGSFIAGGNPRDLLRVKKAMNMLRRLVEGQ